MSQLRSIPQTKQYGLIKAAPRPAQRRTLQPAAFGELNDDDEGEDGNNTKGETRNKGQTIGAVNKLLAGSRAAQATTIAVDDASIYDYDGTYDDFKSEAPSHKLSSGSSSLAGAPKAKYINNLLTAAKVREKEKDRVFERILAKERKEEDEQFGDKEKFVTSAYKAKLMEMQKWEQEDRITDAVEAKTDVRSRGMQGFYSNLLTKNISMGSDVASSALSAYTTGSARNKLLTEGTNQLQGEEEDDQQQKQKQQPQQQQQKEYETSDQKQERQIGSDETELKKRKHESQESAPSSVSTSSTHAIVNAGARTDDFDVDNPSKKMPPPTSIVNKSVDVSEKTVEAARESKIMSARDRYLARKQSSLQK